MDGGIAAYSFPEMAGVIEGEGELYGSMNLLETGKIRVGVDETLAIHGMLESAGTVEVLGGALRIGNGSDYHHTFHEQSTMLAEQSHLTFQGEIDSRGAIELIESTLHFRSDVFRSLKLVMQDSELESEWVGGSLSNEGTIEILPGTSAIKSELRSSAGELVIHPNAKLEVGASQPSSRQLHDLQSISLANNSEAAFYGSTFIMESLAVELSESNLERPSLVNVASLYVSGSFALEADAIRSIAVGQTYKVIESDRLDGSFNDYTLSELPGALGFLPEVTNTTLSLRVIDTATELPGDFNADGRVDAADYTVWRDGLPGGRFELDHLVWRKNYGRELAGNATSVPEPATLAPMLIALLSVCRLRRATEVG
ncbi:hypothetical protein MalM25_00160 [Planctomycetes bacterium MalM25]|nr:hypothetical protein MalM25_00160 [Planctomycetes bacterium MalM25]